MSVTKTGSILQTLDLDAATIEALPEPVLSELIGFIEYDNHLDREDEQLDYRPSRASALSIVD